MAMAPVDEFDDLVERELRLAIANSNAAMVADWHIPNDAKNFDENDYATTLALDSAGWAPIFWAAVDGLNRSKR